MKIRFGCLLVAFALLLSIASCKKESKEKETEKKTGCVEATEQILDCMIACDYKKMRRFDGFDEKLIEFVKTFADTPAYKRVIQKAYYEIDESSIVEKKSRAFCEVDVKVPDYSSAISSLNTYDERFYSELYDAINKQSTKQYKTIFLEMNYIIEDGEYILTNPSEVVYKFYSPLGDALIEYGERLNEEKEKTDNGLFTFKNLRKTDLSEELFVSVLEITHPSIVAKISDGGLDNTEECTKHKIGVDNNISYMYFEFISVEACREYAETMALLAKDLGQFYKFSEDWGCSLFQLEGTTWLVYYSDSAMIEVVSSETTEIDNQHINDFIEELTNPEHKTISSDESNGLSEQLFVSVLENEGYSIQNYENEDDENVVRSIRAYNEDRSIILTYDTYKDSESAKHDFNGLLESAKKEEESGDINQLTIDLSIIRAKTVEDYICIVLNGDSIIGIIAEPITDENIATAEALLIALGISE